MSDETESSANPNTSGAAAFRDGAPYPPPGADRDAYLNELADTVRMLCVLSRAQFGDSPESDPDFDALRRRANKLAPPST